MQKNDSIYILNLKNVKKYQYKGSPLLSSSSCNNFRKKSNFFLSPEKFSGEENGRILNDMRSLAYNSNKNVTISEFQLRSTDNAVLDSVEIHPQNATNNPLYVINMFGGCDAYEQNLNSMIRQTRELGVVNLGYNYPGIVRSTGTLDSVHTALKSGVSQVIRLVEKGVNPARILLSGHSYGAAFAVICAAHLHKVGIKVNVFHNRAFGHSKTAASAFMFEPVGNYTPQKDSWKSISPKKLAATMFISFLSKIYGWEMDVISAWNKIPAQYKQYILIKPDKNERQHITGDEMVRHRSSLHFMIRNQRKNIKSTLKKCINLSAPDQIDLDRKITRFFLDTNNENPLFDILKKLNTELKSLNRNLINNFESHTKYNSIQNMVNEFKTALLTNSISDNQIEDFFIKINNELKLLKTLTKYENKFTLNLQKLIDDLENKEIVTSKYLERCDRFVLPHDGDVASNIAIIEKSEPYFARWMFLGLLNAEGLNKPQREQRIKELAQKMDIHAIPLEYIIQRKEKPGQKLDGRDYYDNLLKNY